jgi:hypothetical protein
MSFWTAVVMIVALGALSALYRARLQANAAKADETVEQLSQRLARVEEGWPMSKPWCWTGNETSNLRP